tara:strand:- start:781 stop:918 length:138 start_codon:yes stop_codon:yes gene_type:complete
MLARDVKGLLDLLLVTKNKDDIITIYGAIQFKLEMIRRIIDDETK